MYSSEHPAARNSVEPAPAKQQTQDDNKCPRNIFLTHDEETMSLKVEMNIVEWFGSNPWPQMEIEESLDTEG